MNKIYFDDMAVRSEALRAKHHALEIKHHGKEWSVEEDALAFLTDAALVGRLVMANQGRWPREGKAEDDLRHKIGECIWWLTVIAQRSGIDVHEAVQNFIEKTEDDLGIK